MNVLRVKTYDEMSRIAADIIGETVRKKPDCVLGLATGSTPLGTYRFLQEDFRLGRIDFSAVSTVNLDEYCGLSGDNVQSYRYFMNKNLFDGINIDKSKTFVPCGTCADPEKECEDYEKIIESLGGIDLQVLGIGLNGHIGFNEPSESFPEKTHVTVLKESTVKANSRFFEREEDVPTMALTMGIGTILSAKKIILLANGQNKKDIIERAISGEITPLVPASCLQKHPDVTVIYSEN